MPNAAIYARQSVDKKDSISIETQIELCRATAMSDDIEVYSDKGYTGSNTNRPAFQKLMNDIRAGRIQKVYVYKLDRISRSLVDFMKMMEVFRQYGCEFASHSESFDTSTPIGRAMLQMCMVFAELERENTIQRVKDAYKSRSKEGFYMGGRVPYGFRLEKTTIKGKSSSMYVPILEEAEQLRMIFEIYSHPDMSLNGVVKYLIEHDIKHLRGSTWQTSKLSDIIKNPSYVKADARVYRFFQSYDTVIENDIEEFDGTRAAYMFGRRTHGRKFSNLDNQMLVLAPHEGIIDTDIWLKCQAKLARNKQIKRAGTGKNSWLTGKVHCGKCGACMKIVKSNTRRGRYFNCTGRSELHICEGHSCTLYADDIESIVSDEISKKLRQHEFKSNSSTAIHNSELNMLNIQLSKIESEIEQLLDKLSAANDALLKYINKRISELDAQKQDIEKQIASKQLIEDNTDILELSKIWEKPDFENKKLIAQAIIDDVRIVDNNIDIIWKI